MCWLKLEKKGWTCSLLIVGHVIHAISFKYGYKKRKESFTSLCSSMLHHKPLLANLRFVLVRTLKFINNGRNQSGTRSLTPQICRRQGLFDYLFVYVALSESIKTKNKLTQPTAVSRGLIDLWSGRRRYRTMSASHQNYPKYFQVKKIL